ncbi:MAG: quinol dehydrogenase ferredoxin subunit NapH [Gammaproteobacteria bacterium]|jgi:ferredoxin-type protein NapH|nr:quinol dehydrogenase ferredoxin subunit NapH [Gammaproteobacteria bacterium]
MEPGGRPGAEAIANKGWLAAHRYLILRRISQLGILALFLLGPLAGVWIVKGNLASSLTLDVLPLTDPLVLLQVFLSGHIPESSAIIGASIVLAFYLLVGGRVYCSWVCPINIVTDTAEWLRRKLKIKNSANFSSKTRYWLLGGILLVAAVSGSVAWELINPVSIVYRGLVFGMGLAWGVVAAVFLLDLFVGRRAWCGRLCPVGAFYGLLGEGAVLRISAVRREQCDDCMDCFAICPEHQVIRPALKGADKGVGPLITSGNCTNCGRCIDVCARDVFEFTTRFPKSRQVVSGVNQQREVSS